MISVNKKMGESIEVMLMRTIYQLEAVLLLVLGLFSILDTGDISLNKSQDHEYISECKSIGSLYMYVFS